MTVESARGLLSSVIDESTWGQAIKKAAVYSIDNGYKHIQGAEFKMTYLGEENAIFAPTLAINLELMGNPGCTFKFVSTYTHRHKMYVCILTRLFIAFTISTGHTVLITTIFFNLIPLRQFDMVFEHSFNLLTYQIKKLQPASG